jgi:hypothetical protein
MTEDLLHSFLRQTENAELPEGEYLKVCNALKKTFEEMNNPSSEVKTFDTTFILRFETDTDVKCVFSVSKYLTIRGAEPNMAIYSLKITCKDIIIKDVRNKEIKGHQVTGFIELIMTSYTFDNFGLETEIGDTFYDVDDVRQDQFNMVKSNNDRGLAHDNDEYMNIGSRPEIDFVERMWSKVLRITTY